VDGSRRADVSQEGERNRKEAGRGRFSEKGSTKDEVEPGMTEK